MASPRTWYKMADNTEMEIMMEDGGMSRARAVKTHWKHWTAKPWIMGTALFVHLAQLGILVFVTIKWFSSGGLADMFSFNRTLSYIAWQYLPIASTVFLGIFWQAVNKNVIRLEPFYQLSQPQGATLKGSLGMDYMTAFGWAIPFRAFFRHGQKHVAVGLSSITFELAFGALPLFATLNWICYWDYSSGEGGYVSTNTISAIICAVVLITILISGTFLTVLLAGRQSGLFGDPSGIGGIAALVADSDVLDVFRSLRSYDTNDTIEAAFSNCRMRLEYDGNQPNQYKIVLVDQPDPLPPANTLTPFQQKRSEAHSWWLWGRTYIALAVLICVPNAVTNYAINNGVDPLAYKVCTTIVSIINAAVWTNWQLHTALLEPYYKLAASPNRKSHNLLGAGPEALSTSFVGSPLLDIFATFKRGQSASRFGFISFCALIQQLQVIVYPVWNSTQLDLIAAQGQADDVLDIVLPPWYAIVYWTTVASSIPIVIFFIAGLIVVMMHRRRTFLPRIPYTLASTILYICQSKSLLNDVRGTSTLSKDARDARLRTGNRYGLGWLRQDLGQGFARVAIDRIENIESKFVFGKALDPNAR